MGAAERERERCVAEDGLVAIVPSALTSGGIVLTGALGIENSSVGGIGRKDERGGGAGG